MRSNLFDVGTHVAWRMMSGKTMAGEVVSVAFYPNIEVRRVDGCCCAVRADKLRAATDDDIKRACAFFAGRLRYMDDDF